MTDRIKLQGGLRDGEEFDVNFLGRTVRAPGAYEDSVSYWNGETFSLACPTEFYELATDGVYVYSHTEPAELPEARQ